MVTHVWSDPLMCVASASYSKIKQGLFGAFAYNALGIPGCAGHVESGSGRCCYGFSSVSVVGQCVVLHAGVSRDRVSIEEREMNIGEAAKASISQNDSALRKCRIVAPGEPYGCWLSSVWRERPANLL